MSWLLWGSILVLALFGLPLLVQVRGLRRVDVQVGARSPVEPEQMPDAIRSVIDAEAAKIAARGFERVAYERVDPFLRSDHVETWGATLWCAAWRTAAVLTTTANPDAQRPLQVAFFSILRDGTRLLTTNGEGWAVVGEDARTEIDDAYVHDLGAHCDAHFERLRGLARERHPIPASYAALQQAWHDGAAVRIAGMAAAGDLRETGDGAWHMTVRGALRWARIFASRARPYQRWLAEAKRRAATLPAAPPAQATTALQADAFYRNREIETRRRSSGSLAKAALLVGTLALFALSFAGGFDAIGLAVLAAVLLFHELGHWVAMHAFGYRDTSIFFIPFLGAATSGHNADATATQRMLVYLLGPVPGLLLGIALVLGRDGALAPVWALHPELVDRTSLMLLVLNFLNLLPVLPLDGGHIARLLLFGRHPWSEVAFRVLALAGLFGLGVLLHTPVLGTIAALSALALPQSLRTARLGRELAKLRRSGARPSERSLVEHAFAWIARSGHAKRPFAQQYALVRDAILNESAPSPGMIATLGLGALYLVCLVAGPALALADLGTKALLSPEFEYVETDDFEESAGLTGLEALQLDE